MIKKLDNTYSLVKVTRDHKIKYKSLKGKDTHIIFSQKCKKKNKIHEDKIQPGMGLPRGTWRTGSWCIGRRRGLEMGDPRGRKVSPKRRWEGRRKEGTYGSRKDFRI